MELNIDKKQSEINNNEIDDTLLAGLYSSGLNNLNFINLELFNLILNKTKSIIRINYSDDVYETTLALASLQFLNNNLNSRIAVILPDIEKKNKIDQIFKKISKFDTNITISDEDIMIEDKSVLITQDTNNLNLIISFDLIIVQDSINPTLIEKFIDTNKIIIYKDIDIIEKTIKKPIDIIEETDDINLKPLSIEIEQIDSTTTDISNKIEEKISIPIPQVPKIKKIEVTSKENKKELKNKKKNINLALLRKLKR